MANQEQLEILKQGVNVWNKWRAELKSPLFLFGKIDLGEANLADAILTEANLKGVNLVRANLVRANLERANLDGANLERAYLTGANLKSASLRGAYLGGSDLSVADISMTNLRKASFIIAALHEANLERANLEEANLMGAHLEKTVLREAYLSRVNLRKTNFKNANFGGTVFIDTDLSETISLETGRHEYLSYIDIQTLQRFRGRLPLQFLRGCGLSDVEIESAKLANPDMTNDEINRILYKIYELRATQSIQISPLFISYSHADSPFVDHIDQALTAKGIRFWRDIHDAKAGRLETQIDLAIRQNPTVLLILSKNSLSSDWVEHEVRHARKLEKELGRDALCPIALDDAWKSSRWPERVMEQIMEYNILDFSGWEDKSTFEAKFAKLLNGLDLFYKKPEK
jgi:uncharacterized protein YjbI with pentapeptide repeats